MQTLGISGTTGRRQDGVDLIGGTGVVGVQRVNRRKAGAGAMILDLHPNSMVLSRSDSHFLKCCFRHNWRNMMDFPSG